MTKKQEAEYYLAHFTLQKSLNQLKEEIFTVTKVCLGDFMCFHVEANCLWLMSQFSFETLGKCFLLVTYADIFCIEDVGE